MRNYLIITPEYGEVVPITDEGQGPMEYQRDVFKIKAKSRRDALILGVSHMRKRPREFHYFRSHTDGNPFVGVQAIRPGENLR